MTLTVKDILPGDFLTDTEVGWMVVEIDKNCDAKIIVVSWSCMYDINREFDFSCLKIQKTSHVFDDPIGQRMYIYRDGKRIS